MIIDFVCQANLGRSDGGQETWAYQFIPALLQRNPEVRLRVYGQRPDGRPDNRAELMNAAGEGAKRLSLTFFPARPSRFPLMLQMFTHFRKHKAQERLIPADVALGVGSVMELLYILVTRPPRKTLKIIWLRGLWFDSKAYRVPRFLHGFARALEIEVLRRADLVLANGDDIANYYRPHGLDVKVIKNAVDAGEWRMPRPAFKVPVQVAYLGRLSPEKGIFHFLQVAERAQRQYPSKFCFHVIGDGYHREQVKQAAQSEVVMWHGAVNRRDLPGLLRQIDVCVAFTYASQASGGGGTSNAMMEQLAAGRLILAWDNAIFRQWLDERSSYLIPQGDVDAALKALGDIVREPDEAARRARVGEDTIAGFDVSAMMDRFEQVLKTALVARRSRPNEFDRRSA